ncbi:MAG: PAS domain S-box protein [Balneolaceae bacterium]|nr:PAS domain S-box protein [Balneolaceae bacterium]
MSDSNSLMINALPGAAAILDAQGKLLMSNRQWINPDAECLWYGGDDKFENYFERCQKLIQDGNDYALKLFFGLRSVIDNEKEKFVLTLPCMKSREEKRWFKISVTRYDENGEVLLMVENDTRNMESLRILRESSEIYSQHFKNTLAGIILGTPEGEIIDVNPAACKILGYTRDELLKGGRDLIVDMKSPHNSRMYRTRDENSIYEGEREYVHKDGSLITVEVSSVLYRNENGDTRTINTFRDKTVEKESLQNLQEEKRFTKAALDSIPNAFFVIDDNYKLIQWNNSFMEELGYDSEDLYGSDVFGIVVPKDQKRVAAIVGEAFESGMGHVITEVMSKSKGKRHYHFYGNSFESRGRKYLVGTGTDITDILKAEKEKDKNYELISQLFESSPLGMVLLNTDARVAKVNESFTRLFGYSKLEIIGESLDKLIVEEGEREKNKNFNDAVFAGNVMKKESIRYTRDGKPLNTIINTIPIFEGDKVVGAYGIYVDVTEQKELEARIQKSLKEKDILLQEVHHRVKNNLAIIAGLIDLQIMEENDPQMQYKLNEVRSRIFSIAKIHESLYEKEDVVQIRFDQYLKTILEALPQKSITNGRNVMFDMDLGPVILNLNQSVPFGLAINELMNVIMRDQKDLSKLKVTLRERDLNVDLFIQGEEIRMEEIESGEGFTSFYQTLIKIFLSQINGSMNISKNGKSEIRINFKKMNIRGSSSSIIHMNELFSN